MSTKIIDVTCNVAIEREEERVQMMDIRKGPWTMEEDSKLTDYVTSHGEGHWNSLARCSGLKRTGKSCRLRWLNYLRPDVRRGNITLEEQLIILELHSRWGNRWSKIAQHLPGRTDNEIKNYWRTKVQKQAKQLKCDVNSTEFKDIMRGLWLPRLVEQIQASSEASTAQPTNTTTNHGSYQIRINADQVIQTGFRPVDPILMPEISAMLMDTVEPQVSVMADCNDIPGSNWSNSLRDGLVYSPGLEAGHSYFQHSSGSLSGGDLFLDEESIWASYL